MCVSVSGRCFTSQFLFNKSANRGECLHPCRRSYSVKDEEGNELKVENNQIFSAKDLCTLPFIEQMKKAGIKAFKIEGRNRDARYVDAVVRIYRNALDKKLTKEETEKGIKELEKIYNKGYSSGFYLKLPTSDDFSKTQSNASSEKKHFVGKVVHYFDNVKVAAIKLVSEIKVGDKIVIIGNTTGIVHSTIDSIEINRKPVKKAEKGKEIGIKVPNLVRKNDEVYLIVKN
jgi:putative protease